MSCSSCYDSDPRSSGWGHKEGVTNLLEWVRGGFLVQELLSCILKTEEELVSFMP